MVAKKISVVEALNAHPDKEHWEAFRKYLLKSKAKYYKAFFPKKLKSKQDMREAYVVIYDSKYVPMFKIPITMTAGGKLQGATIYFKELLNTNKDYKEWIA